MIKINIVDGKYQVEVDGIGINGHMDLKNALELAKKLTDELKDFN